ncbi:MAG: right-handed parallel beta-helix repeat-containing protein [Kiritimatiellae bacterium]|nr:right-handed parallel beta-helix repeat-containing protein [Kiritimatiellia bacterium]
MVFSHNPSRTRAGACFSIAVGLAALPLSLPGAAGLPPPAEPGSRRPARELDLQARVDTAISNGTRRVTLPPGRFRLVHGGVLITGATDFTLEGAGPERTHLVGRREGLAVIHAERCTNLTVRGVSLDLDAVAWIQGTITRVHANGHMDFATHAGYDPLTEANLAKIHGTAQFFDRETRRYKKHSHWFGPRPGRNVVRLDDTRGQLRLNPAWADRVAAGDFVMLKTGGRCGMLFRYCDSVRVEDVTILGSGSIGLGARFLTGDNVFNFAIRRGPTPPGATEPRLLGSKADGCQIFWCPGSVTFEHCDIGFTGDDCINISLPQALQVEAVLSPTRLRASVRTREEFVRAMEALSEPGDMIRIERYGTFEPVDAVPLKAFTYEGHREGVDWLAAEGGTSTGPRTMGFVTLELQRPPAAAIAVGDRLVPRKFLPRRFAVRNCRLHDTFARGLLVMASNGVIENNTIEHVSLSGMHLGHEIPGFGGVDWLSDVVVRGNTIRDTCFDADIRPGAGHTHKLAALQLCNTPVYHREPLGAYPWATGHRNIRIVDNRIEDSGGGGILVNGLDGGEVRGNTVRRTNRRGGRDLGNRVGLSLPFAITLMNTTNVVVRDNRVADYGLADGPVGDLGVYP